MNFSQESWEYYLEYINDSIYHYGIRISGTPDNLVATCESRTYDAGLPEITFTVEVEPDRNGVEYTYFMPSIKLPEFDSALMTYHDDMHYFLSKYAESLSKFTQTMIDNPFEESRFTLEEEY